MSDAPARQAPLLSVDRHRQLHRRLVERGSIRVGEEAKLFNVSEETIRRDIKQLTAAGIADAVFGGAVLRADAGTGLGVPSVDERGRIEEEAKAAIGAAAARHVRPGDIVILDAGTTTLAVAHHLRQHENLTVITNSLVIAQVASRIPGGTVYVVGGKLVPESWSMVGPQATRDLARIHADWAFLGTAAVDHSGRFTSADPDEAEVKRAMIRAARASVIVADHTKFSSRGFVVFAEPADVHLLLTTPGAPPAAVATLGGGLPVEICSPDRDLSECSHV